MTDAATLVQAEWKRYRRLKELALKRAQRRIALIYETEATVRYAIAEANRNQPQVRRGRRKPN